MWDYSLIVYIYMYTVYRVISPRVIFALIYLQTASPWLEFKPINLKKNWHLRIYRMGRSSDPPPTHTHLKLLNYRRYAMARYLLPHENPIISWTPSLPNPWKKNLDRHTSENNIKVNETMFTCASMVIHHSLYFIIAS